MYGLKQVISLTNVIKIAQNLPLNHMKGHEKQFAYHMTFNENLNHLGELNLSG